MRVLLISANTEQINMPVLPLGLAFIATAAGNAGHEVRLIDMMDARDKPMVLKEGIRAFNPQAIGISVRNIDDQSMHNPRFLLERAKQVVADCRELSEAPVVLGGAGYSIFPERALAYLGADMGIQGEGEKAFLTLLERLGSGVDLSGIAGLYLRESGLQDDARFSKRMDDLPLPLPDDHPWIPSSALNNKQVWIPFQTRRGCPLGCSYCSTASIEGRVLRKQSPDRVLKVLSRYVEAGFRQFQFVDNTFNLPPSYAEGLCDGILAAGLNIGWLAIIYPANMDERLVEKMKRAGCRGVSLGFESGSDKILRRMNKRFETRDIRRTSQLFKKHGIRQMGFLLLGGPGEDKETVKGSLAFAESLDLETMRVTVGIRIYPFTSLAETAVEEGMIAPDADLLCPSFYLARGLEDWLRKTVDETIKDRPHWIL